MADPGGDSLSTDPNRRQNISLRISSSAKSTVVYTQALSLPLCSVRLVPGITMWLARIFSVFSCLISSRIFLLSLFSSSLSCPTPRSFHSLASGSNLYSLHFISSWTVSASSPVVVSTSSSSTTGLKVAWHSSSVCGASASPAAAGDLASEPSAENPAKPVPAPKVEAEPNTGTGDPSALGASAAGEDASSAIWILSCRTVM
mmetsp:Transcript_26389/g.67841  ORF Transcript_26389/g.67841 Transcript_26389/m.67841 type:complete len:202 (-) Transcript_26389:98-703(-)